MKINFFRSLFRKHSWRTSVALAFLCLVCVGLSQSAAQLRDQKRITSLQIGDAIEGSRVSIVSDSALSDYEAFRRGDRFYVRLPLADFSAAQPKLQGDGFDDVQVQKVGDSIVISFKLQPGASARVDQRSNRLEVIFSSPARLARNNNSATAVRSRVISARANGTRDNPGLTAQRRASDAAGPVPPGSPNSYDARSVSESTTENRLTDGQSFNGGLSSGRSTQLNKASSKAGPVQTSPSPSPSLSVSPSKAPIYPPLTSATPLTAPANAPASARTSVWTARSQTALQWATANRWTVLLGFLVLVVVVVFLSVVAVRRRKMVVKARRANAPKVKPKYAPDVDLEDILGGGLDLLVDESEESEYGATSTFSPTESAHLERELRERVGRVTEPYLPALEVGTWQDRAWSSADSAARYSGSHENWGEHEREVIEL